MVFAVATLGGFVGLCWWWGVGFDEAEALGTATALTDAAMVASFWLAARPQAWRDRVEVVAMDGFTGFKTATTEELPDAVTVMDPFHVVRLAGDALDRCRRRVQQNLHGHRGRKNDPLYRARRTLHTGAALLTDKQRRRLRDLCTAWLTVTTWSPMVPSPVHTV